MTVAWELRGLNQSPFAGIKWLTAMVVFSPSRQAAVGQELSPTSGSLAVAQCASL